MAARLQNQAFSVLLHLIFKTIFMNHYDTKQAALPAGWKWVKLGEVTINFDGKRIPLSRNVRAERKGTFRYYGATEIVDYIDNYIFDGRFLLIGEDGANLLSKTKPLAFIVEGKFWVNNHAHIVKCQENYSIDFLNFYFNFLNINEYVTGTAQPKLNQANLNKIPVPLPPLPIQSKIVAQLESLLSELDNGTKQLRTAQAQLKTYRQAVLKFAFEGKFTGGTDGWKWVKMGEVCQVNPKIPNKESIENELVVQFLPMKLVEALTGKINLSEFKTYGEVKKGYTPFIEKDVLFAKVTPCMENGKMAIVQNLKNGIGFGSSEFHVLRGSNLIHQAYIFHFVIQQKFRNTAEASMTGAVGLRRVPRQFLENYIIPLPPLAIQQKIVAEIETRLSICDALEGTLKTSLAQSETLRQSLLKQAFEGKLVR
jgi:type I restriction enzyme, S subunit